MGSEAARCAENIVDPGPSREEELAALVEAQRRDWLALNEFLVATAQYYGWCGSFERRLELYNECFQVLKLRGRTPRERGRVPDPFVFTGAIRELALAIMVEGGESQRIPMPAGEPDAAMPGSPEWLRCGVGPGGWPGARD